MTAEQIVSFEERESMEGREKGQYIKTVKQSAVNLRLRSKGNYYVIRMNK